MPEPIKVTLNLNPRAVATLDDVTTRTGDTKTAAINRAVRFYAWVLQQADAGGELVVEVGGSRSQVVMS